MNKTYKEDHKLMELLKISEISRIICDTNMGTLKLRIRKGEKEYKFVLDSVELDKATNKEVFELLYPSITKDLPLERVVMTSNLSDIQNSPVTRVYPRENSLKDIVDNGTTTVYVDRVIKGKFDIEKYDIKPIKRKGRPKGSKNK